MPLDYSLKGDYTGVMSKLCEKGGLFLKHKIFRWCFYLLGLLMLATGLTLNTKTGLGTSAIISVPFSISEIWNLNFGNVTYGAYIVFVAVQLLLCHRSRADYSAKQQRMRLLQTVLQLPFSFVFTRIMNLISLTVPVLTEGYPDSFLGSFPGRVCVLLLAVTLMGCGTAMSLNMRIVHNPGDGIVRAIAEATGKTVGFTKNCFDFGSVCISLTLGFVFTGGIVGVGLGTVTAVLGTGRVVSVFNRFFSDRLSELAGLEPDKTAKRARK